MKHNNVFLFQDIKINETFYYDGSVWVKQSTRTARLYSIPNRWFYFAQNDLCSYPTLSELKQG